MYYRFLQNMLRMGRLTAAQAWHAADEGLITEEQAEALVGARATDSENV